MRSRQRTAELRADRQIRVQPHPVQAADAEHRPFVLPCLRSGDALLLVGALSRGLRLAVSVYGRRIGIDGQQRLERRYGVQRDRYAVAIIGLGFWRRGRHGERVPWTNGEPVWMLSQQEADEFMAADKVVPDRGWPVVWEEASDKWVRWRGHIEVSGLQEGEVFLVAQQDKDQRWTFNSTATASRSIGWRCARNANSHSNPPVPRDGFPPKVRARVHEHIYVEGWGTEYARPVECGDPINHGDMLAVFCRLARVTFHIACNAPVLIQSRIDYA